jgi:EAL domain-containing protein (putative c-di-GMP-specific phosphodiesterase class I)
MNTAVAQLANWWRNNLRLSVSINISGWHLQREGFVEELRRALEQNPLAPADQLGIEILETAAITDLQKVSAIMADCVQLGVTFALDDFGTGYSSLTYLRRLSARTLKIDRTFVRDMLTDSEDCAIVEGIIGLARAFDRRVIAEGVESVAHGAALLRLGCTQAQGYGIARPMPADDLPVWINSWRADPSWVSEAQGPRLASGNR